ncbi:MAG: sulfotransferase family protein [Methylococcaceae bacterium]
MIRKIFCIGFHKTATTSLQVALEQLGIICLGYDAGLMNRYADGDIEEVLSVIPQYDAFRDWPWPLLYQTLAESIPDAGFILTIRDSLEWLESIKRHAERTGPTLARRIVYGAEMPHGHESHYLDVYNRHNEDVVRFFSGSAHLLILRIEAGITYKPLCDFLGKPIPELEYPHVYKTR